ncbi:MAG: DUF6603 domain-containing protein [Methylobacter sp.]
MSAPDDKKKKNIPQRVIGWFVDLYGDIKDWMANDQVREAVLADLGLDPKTTTKLDLPQKSLDSIEKYRSDATEKADELAFLSTVEDLQTLFASVKAFIEACGVSGDAAIEEVTHRFYKLMALNFIRLRLPALYWVGQPLGFIEESISTLASGEAYPERIISLLSSPKDYFGQLGSLGTEQEARVLSDAIFFPTTIALAFWEKTLGKLIPAEFPDRDVLYGWERSPDSITQLADKVADRTLALHYKDGDNSVLCTLMWVPREYGEAGLFAAFGGSFGVQKTISKDWKLRVKAESASAFDFFIGEKGFSLNGPSDAKVSFSFDRTSFFQLTKEALETITTAEIPVAVLESLEKGGLTQQKFDTVTDGTDYLQAELEAFAPKPGPEEIEKYKKIILDRLKFPPEAYGLPFVMGSANGTRLEFGELSFSGEGSVRSAGLMFSAKNSALVINKNNVDSFTGESLPGTETRIAFSLGLGLSSDRGFYFEGGTGLHSIIPISKSLGPVNIQNLMLGLIPDTDQGASNLALEAAAALAVKIGPVTAVIDQIGFQIRLDFAKKDPNLGFAELSFGFKPPKGVGLSIDEGGVTGGGFLFLDPEKGQYAGVVQLNLEGGIAVKGLGLIATRLPDNVKGFSLLIIITVEEFKPIPLPLGFKLTGIGGLLAINRTFDEEVLRTGLKNHMLDSVMFPKDPIRNAPQILSNLNRVFPPVKGYHLFGPMAQIAWGTPTLITADLAVVLELGARLRLLILAQVVAILPKRENDLVRLQMDAIGVLDFDQGTAELDATLYDSRLLKKFVLTGDMAMRLKWESPPNFALAIGGLHPAFNPPPKFPKLERIAINLAAGDNPRLRCEAYFALTANTVQFGARAELYASAHGFSIQGETGFDVLIQFDPFYFIADFYAQLQLKRGSTNLFKVRVEGALAGPRPLHIKAKATFEILWWDVSIRIDKTLVEGEKPPLPEPVNVLPQLKAALDNPDNWMSQLPQGQRPMVTLRSRPVAADEVLLHSLGILTVKQNVVPLNMDISRFGQAAPAGARRFEIKSVSLSEQSQTASPVKDFFAPAQFFEMSDDEKLSRPSFEAMVAGISIGSDECVFSDKPEDWLEVDAIEFETIIVDKRKNEPRSSGPKDLSPPLSLELLLKQALFGAAGSSELRRTGKAKYHTTRVIFKITEQSLKSLKMEGVPDDVLEKLQAIKNRGFSDEERFLVLLNITIGDEQTVKFKSVIMKHATTMGKYRIAKEGWSIIATGDLSVQSIAGIEAGKPMSYSEAAQALRKNETGGTGENRGFEDPSSIGVV